MIVHLAHRNACAVPARVEHLARRQLAEIHIGRTASDGPTARFSTAVYGAPPATSTTWARDSFPSRLPGYSATSLIPGVNLPCLYRLAIHLASTSRRGAMRGEIRPGEVDTVSGTSEATVFPGVYQEAPCGAHTGQHEDLITSPTPPSCRRFRILTRVVGESSRYCELSVCSSGRWCGRGGRSALGLKNKFRHDDFPFLASQIWLVRRARVFLIPDYDCHDRAVGAAHPRGRRETPR